MMEFDHVLRIIGEFGPYQRRLYILVNLAIIPAAFQMLMNIFVARSPQWNCSGLNSTETCPMEGQPCETIRYTSTYTSIASEVIIYRYFFLYYRNTYTRITVMITYKVQKIIHVVSMHMATRKISRLPKQITEHCR